MTEAEYNAVPLGTVFAKGEIVNSPDGIYMTDHRYGEMLRWVAKKGDGYPDWTLYLHWADKSYEQIAKYGDKSTNMTKIQELTGLPDSVMKLYRR